MTKVVIVDEKGDGTIPVGELKVGQVGVITKWHGKDSCYIGLVVKKTYKGGLETLGGREYWSDSFLFFLTSNDPDCRARVLPNGTLLRIEDNE